MVRNKSTPKKGRSQGKKILQIGNKQFSVRTKLMKTIRKLQNSVQNCIPKSSFFILIREILQYTAGPEKRFRVQLNALKALQEAAELYLVGLFEDSNLCAAHANRITLRTADLKLVLSLRGPSDIFNH